LVAVDQVGLILLQVVTVLIQSFQLSHLLVEVEVPILQHLLAVIQVVQVVVVTVVIALLADQEIHLPYHHLKEILVAQLVTAVVEAEVLHQLVIMDQQKGRITEEMVEQELQLQLQAHLLLMLAVEEVEDMEILLELVEPVVAEMEQQDPAQV
jgi:hypothetical protein